MYRKVSRIVQRPPLYPFPVSPTISTPTQCLYTLCIFSHSAYLFSKLYERKLQMWQPFAPKFLSHNLYKDIHLHYQTLQNGMGIRFLSHLQNMFKFHQLSQVFSLILFSFWIFFLNHEGNSECDLLVKCYKEGQKLSSLNITLHPSPSHLKRHDSIMGESRSSLLLAGSVALSMLLKLCFCCL